MSPTHQDLSNDTTFSQIKSRVPVPLSRYDLLGYSSSKVYMTVRIPVQVLGTEGDSNSDNMAKELDKLQKEARKEAKEKYL